MKKLLAMLLLIAVLLPSINVEAKSKKVAEPTVSLTYNTKNGNWYVSFKHTSSKAKIYYRDNGDSKFKLVKSNKKYKVSYSDAFTLKAKVGTKYSVSKFYSVNKLMIAKTDKDTKALAKKIIGKANTDFSKFVLISKYCSENWEYGKAKTTTTENDRYTYMHIIYDNQGVCADMAYAYQKLLNAVGVKATYVTDDTSSKYGYDYRKNHAWTHVKIDGQWQLIDITEASDGTIENLQGDIYGNYRDVAESNTLELDNLRLWAKGAYRTVPITNYLQEYEGKTVTWTDDKITCEYTDDGNYTVELRYNKSVGYWEIFTIEDGVETKD